MTVLGPVPEVTVAGYDSAAALQFNQENTRLGDHQGVDFVYGAVVGDELKVGVLEDRIAVREDVAEELERLALVRGAIKAFQNQLAISGPGPFLFPSEKRPGSYQKTFKTVWHATLRRAGVPYFRIYDLRSTYANRLSVSGIPDEFVTRQSDAKVFKKYSQMKLQMKREALDKLNRKRQ